MNEVFSFFRAFRGLQIPRFERGTGLWLLGLALIGAGLISLDYSKAHRQCECASCHPTFIAYSREAPREFVAAEIQNLRVGDRVYVENPTDERDETLGEVERASWRRVELLASKQDGSSAEVTLLRPTWWLVEQKAQVGGEIPLSVPECGIEGQARVLAIEDCPPIATGIGRV